jgi:hypothetical protein
MRDKPRHFSFSTKVLLGLAAVSAVIGIGMFLIRAATYSCARTGRLTSIEEAFSTETSLS